MTNKLIKPGLLGKKIGMTQVFSATGEYSGVTVLEVGPCTVTQVKLPTKEGYNGVQLGFQEKEFRRVNRAQRGHFEKKGLKAFSHLGEIRVSDSQAYKVGQQLTVAAFQAGDIVDVTGVSKGKGFQGVIKRHKKAGGPATHGSTFHRSTGSIGQRTYPGKVFKLMKLPGHMGDEKVTARNLKVVQVIPEKNLLVLSGSVPGGKNAVVWVRNAAVGFENRLSAPKPAAAEAAPETASEAAPEASS